MRSQATRPSRRVRAIHYHVTDDKRSAPAWESLDPDFDTMGNLNDQVESLRFRENGEGA